MLLDELLCVLRGGDGLHLFDGVDVGGLGVENLTSDIGGQLVPDGVN